MLRSITVALLIVSGFVVSACGSDPCSPKCSADPALSAAELKACQNPDKTVKCYAEAKAAADCGREQTVCGTDNKTDNVKTAENYATKCKTQLEAYTTCAAK